MLCQEDSLPFQILFIPGIYCHLLDQELLSFPFLSSPINQILYYLSDIVLEIYTFRSSITFFLSSYYWKEELFHECLWTVNNSHNLNLLSPINRLNTEHHLPDSFIF